MDFDKLCMVFTMKEPYYGILLSAMERVPDKSTSTLGVCRKGNVFRLYYNPDFISSVTDDEVLMLLKHEVLHVAFDSWTLFEDYGDVPKEEHDMQNIAADMEINCYIDFKGATNIQPILPDAMGWERCAGGREYYKRLLSEADNQQQQQHANADKPQQPCNGGLGGDGTNTDDSSSQQSTDDSTPRNDGGQQDNRQQQQKAQSSGKPQSRSVPSQLKQYQSGMDDHTKWPDDSRDNIEQIRQMVDDLLVLAADEVEKSSGKVPDELKVKITDIRKRKPRPVTDWKRFFRRYIGNEFSEIIRKSKKRESRRFPDAAGNRHRRKSHILVAIDTSGSVSMPEYQEFFGQIRTLTDTASFHVVECDAAIQHEYDYKGKANDILHGGGGTRFGPVIDMFLENRRKYDALVYFTDGGASIPSNTPKETLWVISSAGNKDASRYKVNGASVVFIPSKVK